MALEAPRALGMKVAEILAVQEGLIGRDRRRRLVYTCKNGFTVVYRIDLAKVEALEPTAEPEIETGSTVAPVQSGPDTGATVAGVPGPPRPPNHPKTIHKPPTRRREVAADEEAEKILTAYPPDRLRGKASR